MKQHLGIIELGIIENVGENATEIEQIKARFVHYPDCQQLTIWLPLYGWHNYGKIRLIDIKTQKIVDERLVTERLNGGVQILWDTLPIAPSDYAIEIEHPKGGKHVLHFTKFKFKKEKIAKVALPKTTTRKPKRDSFNVEPAPVYRDGFGNIMPNEDEIIRGKAWKNVKAIFTRHLEYDGSFRGGTITYVEGELRIPFSHEMYGGKYHFGIDIFNESQWEAQTKTPLSRRQEIIEFVAQTVQREQASNWKYEIRESDIAYF
jgi:hypothetical protein